MAETHNRDLKSVTIEKKSRENNNLSDGTLLTIGVILIIIGSFMFFPFPILGIFIILGGTGTIIHVKNGFIEMNCPYCDTKNDEVMIKKNHKVMKCKACKQRFVIYTKEPITYATNHFK